MTEEMMARLLEMPLFDGAALEEAAAKYPPEAIELKAGERFEIKRSLVFFAEGKADIVKEGSGRDAYMKTLDSAALIGLATLFADSEEYISTLLAKNDVKLLLFSEGFITFLIESDPHFAVRLVSLLCQKVRYLNRRIDFYTASGAEGKIHEYLLKSCDGDGAVTIPMSKLSDTLGIGRASLYRAISSLEEKGYIIKDGKKITLRNKR